MLKSVFKEIIIVLLLILAIVLVLGIFLYDYVPTNKIVPKIEQYQAPDDVREEINKKDEMDEEETKPIVYEITNEDLKVYEKAKDYDKGKINPFAEISTESGDTSGNTQTPGGNTSTEGNNSSTGGNTSTTKPSTGEVTGIK